MAKTQKEVPMTDFRAAQNAEIARNLQQMDVSFGIYPLGVNGTRRLEPHREQIETVVYTILNQVASQISPISKIAVGVMDAPGRVESEVGINGITEHWQKQTDIRIFLDPGSENFGETLKENLIRVTRHEWLHANRMGRLGMIPPF